MPANAGIHALLCYDEGRSWIPALAGTTGWGQRRWVNLSGAWYYANRPK